MLCSHSTKQSIFYLGYTTVYMSPLHSSLHIPKYQYACPDHTSFCTYFFQPACAQHLKSTLTDLTACLLLLCHLPWSPMLPTIPFQPDSCQNPNSVPQVPCRVGSCSCIFSSFRSLKCYLIASRMKIPRDLIVYHSGGYKAYHFCLLINVNEW